MKKLDITLRITGEIEYDKYMEEIIIGIERLIDAVGVHEGKVELTKMNELDLRVTSWL